MLDTAMSKRNIKIHDTGRFASTRGQRYYNVSVSSTFNINVVKNLITSKNASTRMATKYNQSQLKIPKALTLTFVYSVRPR